MTALRAVTEAAFGGALPPDVADLVGPALDHPRPADFPAGPILPLRCTRPPRAFAASVAGPDAFDAHLAATLGPAAAAFAASRGPSVRRMVDTDGTTAVVYLDDLHGHAPTGEELCLTRAFPSGATTTLTRHGAPPRHLLLPAWQRRVDDALHAGLVGIWSVRWDDAGEVVGVLWINDTRWRGDVPASAAVIDQLGDARWDAVRHAADVQGWLAYPDSVELRADDGWDVTVGLWRPAEADRAPPTMRGNFAR